MNASAPPDALVYLNGRFLSRTQATLDIEDRGTMFADGVYEVIRYYRGQAFAMDRHHQRLRHSLAGIALPEPACVADLPRLSDELVRRNRTPEASVYWQITRGPAPRHHTFPAHPKPTVLIIAYPLDAMDPAAPLPTLSAITTPDVRWEHCSIKSLMLLANVLAKNQAHAAGADEAILHRQGVVTEGSSTNVFAVRQGVVHTYPANQWILGGITRDVVLELAAQEKIPVVEKPVTLAELTSAAEVFITGTTTQLAAVTRIDGRPVAAGRPGPITQRLWDAYFRLVARECP